MKYQDVFLPGTWTQIDPPPDSPNGVYLEGPGPKTACVYAAAPLNSGLLHCLVTDEQHDTLHADGIAHLHFSQIPAGDKGQGGGPAHVFGSFVVEKDGDTVKIYRPGKADPEVVE